MNKLIERIKITDKFILFIYFYMFVMPWNFEKSQMGILTGILLIWWLIRFKSQFLEKLKTLFEFKPLVILIVFIVYTYISVLWSDSFKEGFEHVNQFHKYYFFIIPLLFTSLNKEEAIQVFKVLIISFGFYGLFSIFIYLDLITINETNSNSSNPKGIMAYAIMSTYMAIGSLCALFIAYYEKNKKQQMFFLIIALLCTIALFINKGRTAQLSFILTGITIVILYAKHFLFKLKYFLFLFIIIVLSFCVLYFSGKIDRYNNALNEIKEIVIQNEYKGSTGVRIYFYKAGLEIIKDNFFFGMGPEDNIRLLQKIQENDKEYLSNTIYASFHSQHLDTLTRYGLIGYLLLILSGVYLLYKLKICKEIYFVALPFFLVTFYTSLANVMLIKKPFNYVYISVFVLFSIIAYLMQQKKLQHD